jgi:hypothetical protein
MKLFFVVFVSALALAAAGPQTSKKTASKTPKAAAAPVAVTIPAEAVQGADGVYHYTDPQGKKWNYWKTPFGIGHAEDNGERKYEPAAGKPAAARATGIKAVEDGDTVRFERPGPFGVWKWEKKKADLDEVEKAALENSQAAGKAVSQQD